MAIWNEIGVITLSARTLTTERNSPSKSFICHDKLNREIDFWPNVLKESIKEQDQEEEEKRKQAEAAEAAGNAVNVFFIHGHGWCTRT